MSDRNQDFKRVEYALPEIRPSAVFDSPLPSRDPAREPLPTEIPAQPDFSRLPAHVLHSAAIETLIGQNEDLMARLKVNVRRCSILERQTTDQDGATNDLRRINASLTAQIHVLCEKEESIKLRADFAERSFSDSTARARLLEGFRRRALKWVAPRFKRAVRAEALLYARESELQSLRVRCADAQDRIRALESAAEKDRAILVENYEVDATATRVELEAARSERAYYKERSYRLDDARMKLAEAENLSILHLRKSQDVEVACKTESARLSAEGVIHRREAARLAAALQAAERDLVVVSAQGLEAAKRLDRSEEQFESLQAVWAEAQKRVDAFEQRNEALARINHELARKLRHDRAAHAAGLQAPVRDQEQTASVDITPSN